MISKTGFSVLRIFAATAVAFLFIAAVPVTAEPAFTNVAMDRSNIAPGQSITFSVRTTSQTQFVFALVDGVRTQGSRSSGNNWSLTVTPTRSSTVTIYANSVNNESGASSVSIPITVSGTTANTSTTTTVTIPAAPADLGPVAIASITETPATASGQVQLTVVTGIETTDVWANFDRVNNARGTGRFARGEMISQGTNHRIWTINFRPAAWAAQEVEIGSNRSYNWPGAATRTHNLTLSQPFVSPTNPTIQSVTVSNRNVSESGSITFTIRTNADAEHVWVRTVDGREINASRSNTSSSTRNWTVTFNPSRSGNVVVFANTTRTETGAASRNENISVGTWNASIVGTPTASWITSSTLRITVTTNQHAESVWVVVPGNSNRVELTRTNSGSGNRTWSVDTWSGSTSSGTISVGVSSQTGNVHNLSADDTRSIWSTTNNSSAQILNISPSRSQSIHSGGIAEFRVTTSSDVHTLQASGWGSNFTVETYRNRTLNDGTIEWLVWAQPLTGQTTSSTTFTITARNNNGQNVSETLSVFIN
ncbi:MAG: hypothetical protein LBI27_08760 [Clostridiales bacterium]|nr:hypothetical protein [Clostridiales bacterium]